MWISPGFGNFLAGDAQMPLSAGGGRHGWRQLHARYSGALDVGIDGVWLNWTDKPKPVGELSYTEVSTFEQAAAHIRTLL